MNILGRFLSFYSSMLARYFLFFYSIVWLVGWKWLNGHRCMGEREMGLREERSERREGGRERGCCLMVVSI
jgi:hypothetical protein